MENIVLMPPLRDIHITQPFGENWVDFYKKLGLKGHNGIDLLAYRGCPVYSAHSGWIVWSGEDGSGGICVEIASSKIGYAFKTIYYHLSDVSCKVGDYVGCGTLIGHADNTGLYTTGDHLHFELKKILSLSTLDYSNGYAGAIDPAPYLPKDWDKSHAFHRYGQPRRFKDEWNMRFKNIWLHKQLIKRGIRPFWNDESINALVYGNWDFESVVNPAMRPLWAYLTKTEYLQGKRPFV